MNEFSTCQFNILKHSQNQCLNSRFQCNTNDLINFHNFYFCHLNNLTWVTVILIILVFFCATLIFFLTERFYTLNIRSLIDSFSLKRIKAAAFLVPVINSLPEIIRASFERKPLKLIIHSTAILNLLLLPLTIGLFVFFSCSPKILGISRKVLLKDFILIVLQLIVILLFVLNPQFDKIYFLISSILLAGVFVCWSNWLQPGNSYQINQQVCKLTSRLR